MTKASLALVRVLVSLALVALSAWSLAYARQWILRWRAERLLRDIQCLQVNRSTSADVRPIVAKWAKMQHFYASCTAGECHYGVTMAQVLPLSLRGYPDHGVKNFFPRIINRLGVKTVDVDAGIGVREGIVTERSFVLDLSLPVEHWFDRGGAFVPDLWTRSVESSEFRLGSRISAHPKRIARNLKGPYGVSVSFSPDEQADVRAALMDFRLSCITRISPCLKESDVLPEGVNLLEETHQAIQRVNEAHGDRY